MTGEFTPRAYNYSFLLLFLFLFLFSVTVFPVIHLSNLSTNLLQLYIFDVIRHHGDFSFVRTDFCLSVDLLSIYSTVWRVADALGRWFSFRLSTNIGFLLTLLTRQHKGATVLCFLISWPLLNAPLVPDVSLLGTSPPVLFFREW